MTDYIYTMLVLLDTRRHVGAEEGSLSKQFGETPTCSGITMSFLHFRESKHGGGVSLTAAGGFRTCFG